MGHVKTFLLAQAQRDSAYCRNLLYTLQDSNEKLPDSKNKDLIIRDRFLITAKEIMAKAVDNYWHIRTTNGDDGYGGYIVDTGFDSIVIDVHNLEFRLEL